MRRFVPLVAVLIAGCASSAGRDAQRVADPPLATGQFHRLAWYGGGEAESGAWRGGRCSIFTEWVSIDSPDGEVWIPRASLGFIELKGK